MSEQRDADNVAVCLRGVSKTYGTGRAKVHALREVELEVRPGEIVCLVGPSGCGKTTLVSILSGVLEPDEGSVEVFGTRWGDLSDSDRTRRRGKMVGFVFQDFNLIPTLTTLENVAVPLLINRAARAEAERRSGELLDAVGLGDRLDALPGELSGGMQQRVAIARALAIGPALLVCDEPTANLDAETGQRVMRVIQEIGLRKENGKTERCIVMVTHDQRIFHFADRLEEMEDGRIKPKPTEQTLTRARRAAEDFTDRSGDGRRVEGA